MAENENKAYDFRHNILGQNGLSMASGPLTMKSPLMGSGGDSGDLYHTEKRVYFDVTDTFTPKHDATGDYWEPKPIPDAMKATIDEFFNDYKTTVPFDSLKCIFDGVEYPILSMSVLTGSVLTGSDSDSVTILLDDGEEDQSKAKSVGFYKNNETGEYSYTFFNVSGEHRFSFSKTKTVPSENFEEAAETLKYDDEDGDFLIVGTTSTNTLQLRINKTYEDFAKKIGGVKSSENSKVYKVDRSSTKSFPDFDIAENLVIRGRLKVIDRNHEYYSVPCYAIPVLSDADNQNNPYVVGFNITTIANYYLLPYGDSGSTTRKLYLSTIICELTWYGAQNTWYKGKYLDASNNTDYEPTSDATMYKVDPETGIPIEDESTGN